MKLSYLVPIAFLLSGAATGFARDEQEALARYAATMDALSKQALFHIGTGSNPASVSASFCAGINVGGGGDGSAAEQLKPTDPKDFVKDFVKASATLRADARLYGFDVPLFGVGAEVKPLAKKGDRVSPIVKILGFNMEHEDPPETRPRSNTIDDAATSRERSNDVTGDRPSLADDHQERTIGPLNVFPVDPEMKFVVGPVPCYVCGNAGVGVGLGVTPIPSALGVNVQGNVYLHGWVSSGIGGKYGPVTARVGVLAGVHALDTTVGLRLGACSPLDALISDLRGDNHTDAEIAASLNAKAIAPASDNGWSDQECALFPKLAAPAAWTADQVRDYQSQGAWGGIGISLQPLAVTLSLIAQARIQITPWYSFMQSWSVVVASWRSAALQYSIPLG